LLYLGFTGWKGGKVGSVVYVEVRDCEGGRVGIRMIS
jgi:hypothetical protein